MNTPAGGENCPGERRLQLDSIAQLQVPVIDWKVNQSLYPLLRMQ
jgi:hypothetical protein